VQLILHHLSQNKTLPNTLFYLALFKIYLGSIIDDKVWKGIAEGLNYGLGFMVIFMLHFTVATKQPAMTAARFAEAVEKTPQGKTVNAYAYSNNCFGYQNSPK